MKEREGEGFFLHVIYKLCYWDVKGDEGNKAEN